ncbi:putative DNA binding domain-containing protein [bacterium]|nr:putative DNA binding domain-containing protein [bacterium]
MLSSDKLSKLMNELESDRVEKTIAVNNTDKWCEAICAFANDFPDHRQPGYLLIGVDDQGNPSGIKVTDQLLKNLAATRSDGNILPLPVLTVQKHLIKDKEIAVVEVKPSDVPPVRYKGRIHIRVGPRRALANESEERILSEKRTGLAKTFDARPLSDCQIQDLLLDLFLTTYRTNAVAPEIIEANNRDITEQLSSLRFFDLHKNCATSAGALLFGKNPLQWLSGASILFLKHAGKKVTDEVEDERNFSGDLLTVLRELDAFLPLQIKTKPEKTSTLQERVVRDYPPEALREFLMNAVMHRSYEATAPIRFYWFEDRIEIQNPGGLYGEATQENFPRQNAYRNPVIAEAMKVLGYVNKYGTGVTRAQDYLRINGNPKAEFRFEATYFLVTIRKYR